MSGSNQKPSVGRIVHYVAPCFADGRYPKAHRAAIITDVRHEGNVPGEGGWLPTTVDIMVFNPTGAHWVFDCGYDEEGTKPSSWHWPEYVPAD